MKSGLGACWDKYGSEDKTVLDFVVGGIEEEREHAIGFSAMQMTNTRYHPRAQYFIAITPDADFHPVDCYNAFGPKALGGDEIWLTKDIADMLELQIGHTVTIRRTTQPLVRLGRK